MVGSDSNLEPNFNSDSSSTSEKNSEKSIEKCSEDEQYFRDLLISHSAKLADLSKTIKELVIESKSIEREFNTVVKKLQKTSKKKKNTSRPLSGFAVPTKLTDELYDFLSIQHGTMIARKDVTKMMNQYIVENNCRDLNDRRKIIPNEALKKLFNCGEGENITYFNLQSYMKKHYTK